MTRHITSSMGPDELKVPLDLKKISMDYGSIDPCTIYLGTFPADLI